MKKKLFIISKEIICKTLIAAESLIGLKPPIVSILGYHSISHDGTVIDVTPEEFKFQLVYLTKKFNFISLDDVIDYITGKTILKKPSVVLTFDDGYRDLLKTVVPIIKKHNIPATLFVVSNPQAVNRNELNNKKKLLKLKEIKKLQNLGWTIGSHTITHPNLLNIKKNELEKEVKFSKQELEKYLKTPIHYFAYPKGFYSKSVVNIVSKSLYKAAFTMDEKLISNNTNVYVIPRLGIDRTRTRIQFIALFTYSALKYFAFKKFILSHKSLVINEIQQIVIFLQDKFFLNRKQLKAYG